MSGKRSGRGRGYYRNVSKGDDLLTPIQAARLLDVDVSTLRRWASEGRIDRVFIAGVPFYRAKDLGKIQRPRPGRPRKR
jgi:hypothetical protein